jgi:putative nucleotidyltransferase with HDIG domain
MKSVQSIRSVSPPAHIKGAYNKADVLVSKNINLQTNEDRDRLRKLGVEKVILDDGQLKKPAKKELNEPQPADELDLVESHPREIESTIKQSREQYDDTLGLMKKMFRENTKDIPDEYDIDGLRRNIEQFIETAQQSPSGLSALLQIRSYDDVTFQHSLNVSILAILYGTYRRYENQTLEDLAFGALLHDVGKTKVPREIISSPYKLSDNEFRTIMDHPVKGKEFLEKLDVKEITEKIAYEHHERPSGDGYPEATSVVHPLSRVTAVCDVYEALTARRSYKRPMSPLKAFTILKEEFSEFTETRGIVGGLVQSLGIFPVGSMVTLSNGERAIIKENHLKDLKRPTIVVTHNNRGTELKRPFTVNLSRAAQAKVGSHGAVYDDKIFIQKIIALEEHPDRSERIIQLIERRERFSL